MEQLRAELALVLGEPLSRVECISQQPYASLYTLYDGSGHSLPLVAKHYSVRGIAAQEAHKLSVLMREGAVRMPAVYGLVTSQQSPQHEVLLLERIGGVSVDVPVRSPERWQQLCDDIVAGMLSWHRIESYGLAGTVDSTQHNRWPAWYAQRVEVLWATINYLRPARLCMDDRAVLYRSRQRLSSLFSGFDDPCVLVHGNLTPGSVIKEAWGDRLLAVVDPGNMLWAPREFDLHPLCASGVGDEIVMAYLRRAPVAEGFVARRWLYILWEEIARLIQSAQFDRPRFNAASQSLIPWLS